MLFVVVVVKIILQKMNNLQKLQCYKNKLFVWSAQSYHILLPTKIVALLVLILCRYLVNALLEKNLKENTRVKGG